MVISYKKWKQIALFASYELKVFNNELKTLVKLKTPDTPHKGIVLKK